MHQALLLGLDVSNVTVSGGGLFDCNSELDDGECIVDQKVAEECLDLPEWYSEIENIAKKMAMHFDEAGWLVPW